MGYVWQFGVIADYWEVFVRGAIITVQLSVGSALLALVIGLPAGLCRSARSAWLRIPAVWYIEIIRSTPALVQIVWIYYCLPILTGIQLGGVLTMILALGLHAGAFVAEIFRAGINAVDRGQVMASQALGMSYFGAMRRIILPQAVRKMIPPFINEFASLIKLTTLGSAIAVYELLHESNNLIATAYRPLEVYTFLAVVFFIIIFPIIKISQRIEVRLAKRN